MSLDFVFQLGLPLLICRNSLYILYLNPLFIIYFTDIFLLCASFFILFMVSFHKQMFFILIHTWLLNNMGLKCKGPLIHGFFSIVNTTLLHDPWLVEFLDVEPQIWRDLVYRRQTIHYTHIFGCPKGQCPYPNVVQGSTVVYFLKPLLYE